MRPERSHACVMLRRIFMGVWKVQRGSMCADFPGGVEGPYSDVLWIGVGKKVTIAIIVGMWYNINII